ncbi:hypothetical protein ACIPSA_50675 [Streptomyces sp. NPDC086549]|uniref:hypothetical protein n=1 Tax=Streptomyces sp. NPDC086549 TaxID=3365752 RepID=UPI0038074222
MPRRTRKSLSPTKPLLRTPLRVGNLDAAAIVGELRQLHEEAEDPSIDRMPDDAELFRALLYVEKHASVLKDDQAQRDGAVKRVTLWQYLREQVDLHQAKAVEDARSAGTEWADLMPALAVSTPSAAYNKATRLRAAALTAASQEGQAVRRTPEAVLAAERQLEIRAAAERRAAEEASRRHALLVPVARRLVRCRSGFVDDEDVEFWLDQIEAVLPSCHTATQMVSLGTYLEALVRALKKIEQHTAQPAGCSDESRSAHAAAAELLAH